jgi:hypothetical protein
MLRVVVHWQLAHAGALCQQCLCCAGIAVTHHCFISPACVFRICRIILDIGKQLGRKLLSGNLNLINITLPVSSSSEKHHGQNWEPLIHLHEENKHSEASCFISLTTCYQLGCCSSACSSKAMQQCTQLHNNSHHDSSSASVYMTNLTLLLQLLLLLLLLSGRYV